MDRCAGGGGAAGRNAGGAVADRRAGGGAAGKRSAAAGNDQGFTLMETIVALVVFAGVFVALERGTTLGFRGIRAVQHHQAALTLARAKLASAGVESTISGDSEDTGNDQGRQWSVSVRKYDPPDATQRENPVAAYWVTVTVSWRERPAGVLQTIELKTVKLSAAP